MVKLNVHYLTESTIASGGCYKGIKAVKVCADWIDTDRLQTHDLF